MMGGPDRPDQGGVDLRAVWAAGRYVTADGGSLEVETRGMVAGVERKLREAPEDTVPLEVPFPPSGGAFYLFCILLSENSWMGENSLIISFPGTKGGRGVGFILKRDKELWTSPQALEHLKCSAAGVKFYTIEEYVKSVLEQMCRERGIRE